MPGPEPWAKGMTTAGSLIPDDLAPVGVGDRDHLGAGERPPAPRVGQNHADHDLDVVGDATSTAAAGTGHRKWTAGGAGERQLTAP